MPLRDSFKEHYLLESTRRNELTSALGVPIAILTAVLSALAVIAKELHAPLDTAASAQLALVVLGAGACGLCTYFLFRSLYGLAYAYVPTPQQLSAYRDQLAIYYVATGLRAEEASERAENETLDHLFAEYAKNTERNSTNNDIKSGHLHNANSALIAAVVLTAFAGIFYVSSSIATSSSPSKVEVVNMPSLSTLSSTSVLAASAPPPAPPAPPVKPEPPPSRVVREHRIPPPPPPPLQKR